MNKSIIYKAKEDKDIQEDLRKLKALQQEPCDDCISRQAVLDINESHHGQMPNHINHQIWQEIKDLPSVNPQKADWIPVSERLPKEDGEYLVTTINGDVDIYVFHTWGAKSPKVIAWMPLPKSYKPESEE